MDEQLSKSTLLGLCIAFVQELVNVVTESDFLDAENMVKTVEGLITTSPFSGYRLAVKSGYRTLGELGSEMTVVELNPDLCITVALLPNRRHISVAMSLRSSPTPVILGHKEFSRDVLPNLH